MNFTVFKGKCIFTLLALKVHFTILVEKYVLRFWHKMCVFFSVLIAKSIFTVLAEKCIFTVSAKDVFYGFGENVCFYGFDGNYIFA